MLKIIDDSLNPHTKFEYKCYRKFIMLTFSDKFNQNLPVFNQIGDIIRFENFTFKKDKYNTVKAYFKYGVSQIKSCSI